MRIFIDNERGKLVAIQDEEAGFNFIGDPLELFHLKLTKPARSEELVLDASDFRSV